MRQILPLHAVVRDFPDHRTRRRNPGRSQQAPRVGKTELNPGRPGQLDFPGEARATETKNSTDSQRVPLKSQQMTEKHMLVATRHEPGEEPPEGIRGNSGRSSHRARNNRPAEQSHHAQGTGQSTQRGLLQ